MFHSLQGRRGCAVSLDAPEGPIRTVCAPFSSRDNGRPRASTLHLLSCAASLVKRNLIPFALRARGFLHRSRCANALVAFPEMFTRWPGEMRGVMASS